MLLLSNCCECGLIVAQGVGVFSLTFVVWCDGFAAIPNHLERRLTIPDGGFGGEAIETTIVIAYSTLPQALVKPEICHRASHVSLSLFAAGERAGYNRRAE